MLATHDISDNVCWLPFHSSNSWSILYLYLIITTSVYSLAREQIALETLALVFYTGNERKGLGDETTTPSWRIILQFHLKCNVIFPSVPFQGQVWFKAYPREHYM